LRTSFSVLIFVCLETYNGSLIGSSILQGYLGPPGILSEDCISSFHSSFSSFIRDFQLIEIFLFCCCSGYLFIWSLPEESVTKMMFSISQLKLNSECTTRVSEKEKYFKKLKSPVE
jgi:hypothetical protein